MFLDFTFPSSRILANYFRAFAMSSPNSLARREAKRSKWAQRPGLSVGLGGGGAPSTSTPTEDSPTIPFPSSQAILRGKSVLVICDAAVARQEVCGALYRDE